MDHGTGEFGQREGNQWDGNMLFLKTKFERHPVSLTFYPWAMQKDSSVQKMREWQLLEDPANIRRSTARDEQ